VNDPTWAERLSAWSTFATAVLTLLVVVIALVGWRTAKATLKASREASRAATVSANAAREANEQARRDSIEQTRPYVFVEVLPGLAGTTTWDLRVTNSGQSAARKLVLDYDQWPAPLDDVATAIWAMFETPRTLPPRCSIRMVWRLEGNFTDGSKEAGLGREGTITVGYTSDDPKAPTYSDRFDVMIDKSGLWPVGESGPTPDGLNGDARKFYVLGQALVRRVTELGR
jgi:hypothetical protein